jgi:hypothetical protein
MRTAFPSLDLDDTARHSAIAFLDHNELGPAGETVVEVPVGS